MDPTNTPPSSSNHQQHPNHNKPAPVSPFMRYWLLSSRGNSPATTPEVSRASSPAPTPPHHHASLPPAPPPTPVNSSDLPRPPILPSRSSSTSSITTIPKQSQRTSGPHPPGRPLTASSVPSSSEAMMVRAAAENLKAKRKGTSSSKSWDFLVHGTLL